MPISSAGDRRCAPVIAAGLAVLVVTAVAGCSSIADSPSRSRRSLDARALMLVMSDGLLYESVGLSGILQEDPKSHARLAETLGRVRDARGLPLLLEFLRDSRVEVRRSAAFGLGLLDSREAAPALALATADEDWETGRLAVEALTRLGEPYELWSGALATLPRAEQQARLYPSLFRMSSVEIDRHASGDLSNLGPAERRWLIYAAGRNGGKVSAARLREHLDHEDAWIRGWAARGLGRLGQSRDMEALGSLLGDAAASPVIQALRAAVSLIADGRSAPAASWVPDLLRLMADPRVGVRAEAIEASGYWLPERVLEDALFRVAGTDEDRAHELAVLALARGRAKSAEEAVLKAALSSAEALRSAAATAAGWLEIPVVLEMLWEDPAPGVRLAVLAARLEGESGVQLEIVRRALADQDPAMRAAALEVLADSPGVPIEEILSAMQGPGAGRLPSLRVNGVLALEARHSEVLERGAVLAALEELARDSEFLVRRTAADVLERLGRPRPEIGWVVTGVGLETYRNLAARLDDERYVSLTTAKGVLTFQLACLEAPLTCSSFLQLVNQGFYDGLTFHRVVPDFVVQGGDPRGDGWGGPGYTLRDEATRLRFDRGVLGMAKSSRDDAGSQFFVTLSAQPHLDGAYTAFGRVVGGEAVLDRIAQGDEILSMTELQEGSIAAVDSDR